MWMGCTRGSFLVAGKPTDQIRGLWNLHRGTVGKDWVPEVTQTVLAARQVAARPDFAASWVWFTWGR